MKAEREDLKWDKGKLRYNLILPLFLEGMAEVLTKGEINHPKVEGQPSWQGVEPEAYDNALMRHRQATLTNPLSVDKDMGTSHFLHIAVNAMFLWWFEQQQKEKNNIVTGRVKEQLATVAEQCTKSAILAINAKKTTFRNIPSMSPLNQPPVVPETRGGFWDEPRTGCEG